MERIWLRDYAPGVPADIDPTQHPSLVHMLVQSFGRYSSQTAFACMGRELSYGQVDALTSNFASYLINEAGLNKGDRVAVMLPNLLHYPIAVFGILRAGMTVVNANPLYTAYELEHQLRDSGASAIVVLNDLAATVSDILPRTAVRTVLSVDPADDFDNVFDSKARAVPQQASAASSFINAVRFPATPPKLPDIAPQDVAFLQYTGGTTGKAKGAVLTHRNIVASVMQVMAWTGTVMEEGRSCVITPLPMYHIFPLSNCLSYACLGGKNVLISNPRDIPNLLKEMQRHPFDALIGVNTLFNTLLNTPQFAELNFSKLKLVVGAGASVQQAVAEKWQRITGVALTEAYGLTEASPGVSFNPLHKPDWNGSVGLPVPSTVVSIRNAAGKEVLPGEAGELCVTGPQIMQGYWNRPEETANAFTPDGFLRTGDMATMDDKGYLRIVDRLKDMILVSGFNVYPNEIEAAVVLHPGVLESACIGVADDKTGEAVKLFVVRKDPDLGEEDLRAHCKKYLTNYKQPKHIVFREALPKSPIGKILRKELRG